MSRNKVNHEIKRLFRQYQQGNIKDRERNTIDDWFNQASRPSQRPVFRNAAHEQQVYESLKERISKVTRTTPVVRRMNYLAVAAAVVAAILSVSLYFLSPEQKPVQISRFITKVTGSSGATVRLPDGSLVTLSPRTAMHYPASFTRSPGRNVYLDHGKAFFRVKTDSAHAFTVHYQAFRVRVLGTSFTVDAATDSSRFGVSVSSGKVRVEQVLDPQHTRVLAAGLTRNQSVTCNLLSGEVQLLPKETAPQKTARKTVSPIPSGISLQQLGLRLAARFNLFVQVNYPEKDTRTCTIDVEGQELQPILDELSAFAEVTYDPVSRHLIINPKPENP